MLVFNSTLNSFPKNTITLEYVKERFLAFYYHKYGNPGKGRASGMLENNGISGKKFKDSQDIRPYVQSKNE